MLVAWCWLFVFHPARCCVWLVIQARERIRGIQAELREVTQRLTEMNPGGLRWGAIQEDGEGNIEVDEIMCTK